MLGAADRGSGERADVAAAQAVEDLAADAASRDDAGLVQQAELLARRRFRERGRRGERADGKLAVVEQLGHEPQAAAVAEQPERAASRSSSRWLMRRGSEQEMANYRKALSGKA